METLKATFNETFARDIITGLSSKSKFLPSKYFYDKKGDTLFQQIMDLDEYYLTKTEFEILETHKDALYQIISKYQHINLIELGAGDGTKTKVLLDHFLAKELPFTYTPVDISENALKGLHSHLKSEFPQLKVMPLKGEYFEALEKAKAKSNEPKLVLFLGSTIGNFDKEQALDFLIQLRISLNPGDYLLLGADLIKDPATILAAYNDKEGITKRFNLNLLERINDEFGGNFNLAKFIHYPVYDPIKQVALSYLVSTENQKVYLKELDLTFEFNQWEPIHTEISQKFDPGFLNHLASRAGFEVVTNFMDEKNYFADALWKVE